jgi:tetratricopeptide (TPR) repeat protein
MVTDPNNSPEAWVQAGMAYDQAGRFAEALAAFDRALALNPNHVFAWDQRGLELSELGRYQEALAAHDRALALDPNYANAWYNPRSLMSLPDRAEDENALECQRDRRVEIERNWCGSTRPRS